MGSRIPTNIELVEKSDLIVLARVAEGPPREKIRPLSDPPPWPWAGVPPVKLTTVEVFKGKAPPGQLRVCCSLFKWNGVAPKLQPTKLTEANPEAYEGGCVRSTFVLGSMVVAMFKNGPKGLRALNIPFARQVEDVEGPDSLWPRAIRLYVRALAEPGSHRVALRKLRTDLLRHGSESDRQIADDVTRYLRLGPHPPATLEDMW